MVSSLTARPRRSFVGDHKVILNSQFSWAQDIRIFLLFIPLDTLNPLYRKQF